MDTGCPECKRLDKLFESIDTPDDRTEYNKQARKHKDDVSCWRNLYDSKKKIAANEFYSTIRLFTI